MLQWALIFLVDRAGGGRPGLRRHRRRLRLGIAKILFLIFLVLFAVSLVMHLVRGRSV